MVAMIGPCSVNVVRANLLLIKHGYKGFTCAQNACTMSDGKLLMGLYRRIWK